MIVYGIKNCDTMKKSFVWLDENQIDYSFHDYKKVGISRAKLDEWLNKVDVKQLINTKGTTFKKLTPEQQTSISNREAALHLMLENPSMIKRPLIEYQGTILLGFDAAKWSELFK
jgi:Spx/MgsR family transcriptional regulator